MSQQSCHLIFRNWHLVIDSNVPEVIASCRRQFRHLIGSTECRQSAGLIEIWQDRKTGACVINPESSAAPLKHESLASVSRRLSQEIVARFMAVCPELLWVHAGGVAAQERAVLFVGPWGRGKSTLVGAMIRLGFNYLSDDVVPLDPKTGHALPFPRTPFARVGPGFGLSAHQVSGLPKAEVTLRPGQTCAATQPIGAIVFPLWQPKGPTSLQPKSPGEASLALLGNCMNFQAHRTAAVRLVARLLRTVPAYDLAYSEGDEAAQLINHTVVFATAA